MSAVLGKVTSARDAPRGPDATYRVTVPAEWLLEGATVEVELPRNLTCAACEGGGCDACERSGAISLRERKASPESVRVALPRGAEPAEERGATRALVLRIPEHGGIASPDSGLPRGCLLLAVVPGVAPASGVRRLEPEPPLPEQVAAGPTTTRALARRLVMILIIAALLVLAAWLALRAVY